MSAQMGHSDTNDRVILTSIKSYAFAVLWNFCVTTVIFPGLVTAQFHSGARRGFIDPSWYEVILISTFLFFDFGGRQVTPQAIRRCL